MVIEKLNKAGIRGIFRDFVIIIFSTLLLFISAGTLYWVRGWIYIVIILTYQIFYVLILMIGNPGLLNERGTLNWHATKLHDKYFAIFYSILSFLFVILSGLDVVRFHWSSVPLMFIYPGIFMFGCFALFALWAYWSNSSFILTHREDTADGLSICSIGPYRYVRHPGYLSAIGTWFSFPFLIGSLLSLVSIILIVILLILRTYYEDKTLMLESIKYREYSKVTKYRLIPYIW
jgi:protein-S-isoprenylcysteine O-methyltransferase Ste14